jgi:ComF family protein
MMDVVHLLKYRGKIQLARPLGRCLFAEFMRHWGTQAVDIIVPVPLHTRRLRRRGFNQAYLLVREWRQLAATLGGDQPAVQIDPHVLARNRRTAPQSGLGRQERRANLRKTMTIAAAQPVRGKHVLVVDDVYTTGATADECARTLLAGGAQRVDILTLARVL